MKNIFLVLVIGTLLSLPVGYEYHGPETELIVLINQEREASGAPPLTICWEITRIAGYKSEEMKRHRLFDHESIVYGDPAQTLDTFFIPHNVIGANIAMGQESPQCVATAWFNSPGHMANLVNPAFKKAGVGISVDEFDIPYWTLIMTD